MIGIYKAKRMDTGEEVIGNLIYQSYSPFCYILTKDNFDKSYIDDNGKTLCRLIRVLIDSVVEINQRECDVL